MPDFNAEELRNVPVAAAADHQEDADQAQGNDFRRSVTSLLDAMRDLLNNVNVVDRDADDESEEERQA